MASTEQKAGFRLPWGASAPNADAGEDEATAMNDVPQVDPEAAPMSLVTDVPTEAQAPADGDAADASAASADDALATPVMATLSGAGPSAKTSRGLRAGLGIKALLPVLLAMLLTSSA